MDVSSTMGTMLSFVCVIMTISSILVLLFTPLYAPAILEAVWNNKAPPQQHIQVSDTTADSPLEFVFTGVDDDRTTFTDNFQVRIMLAFAVEMAICIGHASYMAYLFYYENVRNDLIAKTPNNGRAFLLYRSSWSRYSPHSHT